MELREIEQTLKENIDILKHYGVKHQMFVWIEEMSELTKVICKWARVFDELDGGITEELLVEFTDEITDVTVSLDQIKYAIKLFECDLWDNYKFKVDRQQKRISDEIYKRILRDVQEKW